MSKREELEKIIQEVYIAGEEGEPEESAVPSAVDSILSNFVLYPKDRLKEYQHKYNTENLVRKLKNKHRFHRHIFEDCALCLTNNI